MSGEGPIVVRTTPPSLLFGQGDRIVQTEDVLIPPQLDLTDAGESVDPNLSTVYYLLRRYHTGFPPEIRDTIEPIRAKVALTQDLSLLTDDELRLAQTLNNLYNTDIDDVYIATTVPSS